MNQPTQELQLEVGWMRDVVVRDNVEHVRHICPDCLRAAQIGAR
jgi:hypothetical protein